MFTASLGSLRDTAFKELLCRRPGLGEAEQDGGRGRRGGGFRMNTLKGKQPGLAGRLNAGKGEEGRG